MREDMAKVIVTRPRSGWRLKTRRHKAKAQALLDPESAPRRGKIRPSVRTKRLNEHLGPLRRYLWKQRGRPWNEVYSEICANLRPTNTVQQHVRDHVSDFVLTDVREVDGRLVRIDGYLMWDVEYYPTTRWRMLYVCPRSGLLKAARRRPCTWERRGKGAPRAADDTLRFDENVHYQRIDGIWYALELEDVPLGLEDRRSRRDAVLRAPLSIIQAEALRAVTGSPDRYVAIKRQLGKRELRTIDGMLRAREDARRKRSRAR